MTRLALLLFLLAFPAYAQPRTISGPAVVVDGDTLWVGSVKIRIQGLHAPEPHHPGGPEATAWMRKGFDSSRPLYVGCWLRREASDKTGGVTTPGFRSRFPQKSGRSARERK